MSFPQYEITQMLGRGGMGAVYKGWQKSLDRFVAIKILAPSFDDGGDAHFDERFTREAKALAQLKHPGIVAVYDAGETADGLRYFVMEYVEGTDVDDLVAAQGRLPLAQALAITTHVCDALTYAHAHGIIHRDIKPANVMLDADGQVKVGDFGLARTAVDEGGKLTVANMMIGTPEFSAPEAFTPEVEIDQRADLYAVGVMLYQMLTGRVPRGRFASPSRVVPGLDERLDLIVDKAMQTDRAHRYATALELKSDVARLTPAERRTATGDASVNTAPSRRSLPKAVRVGVVVAGLLGVAVIGIAVWKRGHAGVDGRTDGAPSAAFAKATKDAPFVNSLGMKFVPVPIAGGRRVLFSVWETRVQDYEVFVKETGREWPQPTFPQGPMHPAVNVNWDDAQAFCVWLTDRERQARRLGEAERYRLPTDHEWSCAVGLGESEDPARSPGAKSEELKDLFPWGAAWPPPASAGNYSGEEAAGHETWKEQTILTGYRDDFPRTAPAGSFTPNRFGLFDLGGNAWEWCEDLLQPGGDPRVLRGASFNNGGRGGLFSAKRDGHPPGTRNENFGFRVVLAHGVSTDSPMKSDLPPRKP